MRQWLDLFETDLKLTSKIVLSKPFYKNEGIIPLGTGGVILDTFPENDSYLIKCGGEIVVIPKDFIEKTE